MVQDDKHKDEADDVAGIVAYVAGGDDTLASSEEDGHVNEDETGVATAAQNATSAVASAAEDHSGKRKQEC